MFLLFYILTLSCVIARTCYAFHFCLLVFWYAQAASNAKKEGKNKKLKLARHSIQSGPASLRLEIHGSQSSQGLNSRSWEGRENETKTECDSELFIRKRADSRMEAWDNKLPTTTTTVTREKPNKRNVKSGERCKQRLRLIRASSRKVRFRLGETAQVVWEIPVVYFVACALEWGFLTKNKVIVL